MAVASGERRIHFISGLPRSGSTLLSAILNQNAVFHAQMSSPLASVYMAVQERMSARNEYHSFISDRQRAAVSRGLFDTFYGYVNPSVAIFDTNRAWCAKLASLAALFPAVKVICCVRGLAWILDSFERVLLSNPFQPSRMFNFDPGGTVYNRADILMSPTGPLSFAYNALKEAFFGPHSSHLLLVNYETLASRPAETMAGIYEFLGEQRFEHNFGELSYDATAFDEGAGMPGLHTVRPTVEFVQRDTILPPDLFAKYAGTAFWNDPAKNLKNVRVL